MTVIIWESLHWSVIVLLCLCWRQKQPVNPDLQKKFEGIHSEKLFDEKLQKRREKVEEVMQKVVFYMYFLVFFSYFLLIRVYITELVGFIVFFFICSFISVRLYVR